MSECNHPNFAWEEDRSAVNFEGRWYFPKENAYPFDIALKAMAKELGEAKREAKVIRKKWQKAQERLNRIDKLTPGLQRLHNLDRIAMELDFEADNLETVEEGDPEGLRRDALYLRRFEWDMYRLNETVKDRVQRNGGTPSDPGHWRGPRP